MSGWWTWGKHDAAEEAEPEPVAPKKTKRLRPGVTIHQPGGVDWFWRAVVGSDIVAIGGQGYASKQKAEQGLRAAAKVLNAYVAKLDAKKKAKR